MTRKLIAVLAALATAGGGAVAVSGCGAEKAAGVDVAKAAQTTSSKRTAKVAMTVRVSGAGLPSGMTINADGVTDLTKPRGTISLDLASIAQSAGVPSSMLGGSASKLTMRYDGGQVYVQVPQIPLVTDRLNGKSWISANLADLAPALGVDTKSLGGLISVDPASQLKVITSLGSIKKVGDEKLNGEDTTHYKGSYSLADIVAALPADKRAQAQKGLDTLKALPGAGDAATRKQDAEFWIGKDGVLREMKVSSELPTTGTGSAAGRFDLDYKLTQFGVPLDVSAPPAKDTYVVTESAVKKLLGGATGLTP